MQTTKQTACASKRPRVALLVESSMASGRQVLDGIAEYAHQHGGWSFYFEPGHFSNMLPEWLRHWRGDGILARIRSRRTATALRRLRLPVVDVMGDVPNLGIPSVGINHQEIGELAADHLMEHGFRQFGFCGIRGAWWPKWRYQYFREALARFGYDVSVYWLPVRSGKAWSSEAERERMAQWIAALPKPVGIMGCNDLAAQKVLEACRRADVPVPEEAAVVGVDNDEAYCRVSDPMLSSIQVGHDRVGFVGAEMLDQLMHGKRLPNEPVLIGARGIVVRQSTDVQTIADRDVAAAMRFIRERACNNISVRDIAQHVALSYSTLNRRFQQIFSRSIHDEILRVRVKRARELLAETSMPLAQIAEAAGFHHQEYLGAVFKSQVGMTPAQYRDKMSRRPA